MKEEKEKIDLLFERNAAEQLAGVDWDVLSTSISNRLDKADQNRATARKYPTVFKIAASLAAAAAVILIAVMVKTERQAGIQLNNGRVAVVKILEIKGSAAVEIKHASGKAQVMVDIGRAGKKVARCDVKIIDLNGDLKKDGDRAAWIIISRPAPMFVDNGASRDEADLACML